MGALHVWHTIVPYEVLLSDGLAVRTANCAFGAAKLPSAQRR